MPFDSAENPSSMINPLTSFFAHFIFDGVFGPGACSIPGAQVGDAVVFITNLTDQTVQEPSFEANISVADQILQTAAMDLSGKKMDLLLVRMGR